MIIMNKKRVQSYRNILHSTAVFGGTQFVLTLINVVKGKLVAVLLGSVGIGLSSLLTNAVGCIQQIVTLGVHMSVVKEVSQANLEEDRAVLAQITKVLRTLLLISAIAGALLMVVFSPLITRFSVGDSKYGMFFLCLAPVVFLNVLSSGEYALLQGIRKFKMLAYSSLILGLTSLLVCVPLYYVMGIQGIVPGMILTSLISFISLKWFVSKTELHSLPLPRVSLKQTLVRGKEIILLGIVMMLAGLFGTIANYGIASFISTTGSLQDVGFYHAANLIVMQCCMLVFTAMATDYYPKLAAAVSEGNVAVCRLVNQQIEVVLLIIAPVAVWLITVIPILITLLLTTEFMQAQMLMRYMSLAVIFRSVCFSIDYIAVAKGDKNYYFWLEGVFCNVKMMLFYMLAYHLWALDGLGYAILCSGLIDLVVSMYCSHRRYGFAFLRKSWVLFSILSAAVVACFLCSLLQNEWLSYALMISLSLCTTLYCYRQLDKRIDIKSLVRKKLGKNRA